MSDPAADEGSDRDPQPPARVMLDALLSATARNTPLGPRGIALRDALRKARARHAADAALDADAAAALVATALDRVPPARRGSAAAWDRMVHRVAEQLLVDDVAKGKLEQLWSELVEPGGEAA